MYHVPVLIIPETLLRVQATQIVRYTLSEPQVRPVLHSDEAAKELFSHRLGHGLAAHVRLVYDGDGVQQVCAQD